eukprot:CAMPEP_0183296558 /NCGR_PEP_ID=MMETSP0160_2-20130417/4059_1 /TAXON_ID=2839 ORGANISM="Odontella Sinensis, Strain Grunow 1884" /NCGR_SAMPLE_ID=MMETSP0160_2 /ASSEMBLY_ACC=CAM_ASM_000250 /LENGTH=241 /DNA_ID=CAMNT_0025458181 /DNA_START=77 /DNA_END=803 /DNA_ORIENTATION=+
MALYLRRNGRIILNFSGCRSHSTGKSNRPTINAPSAPTSSWERGAKMVKNTDVTNKYLEHIRDTHDPSLHLKTIEDELRGTMGKALGKQGKKISSLLRGMKQERDEHDRLVTSGMAQPDAVRRIVERHNKLRDEALKARWELLVHRQAVGFIVDNHNVVHSMFPIGEAIPVDYEKKDRQLEGSKKVELGGKRKFGNQLIGGNGLAGGNDVANKFLVDIAPGTENWLMTCILYRIFKRPQLG